MSVTHRHHTSPPFVRALGSAPFWSSTEAARVAPHRHAECSGSHPSCVRALTLAPWVMSTEHACVCGEQ